MNYTITFLEDIYRSLKSHLFSDTTSENAAYVYAGISRTQSETRFIAREFVPVDNVHILNRSVNSLAIQSTSYVRAAKYSSESNQALIFVHSHPETFDSFSDQDDREESKLFELVFARSHRDLIHASMIIPIRGTPRGRVWTSDVESQPISRIRVVGERFHFYDRSEEQEIPAFYDRQVRAFGKDVQLLLRRLNVAVVGCGGTGSAVAEQLIRLGVGTLSIYDPQRFEETNVNRVYNSNISDNGTPKVSLIQRTAMSIGLGTIVKSYPISITTKRMAESLRDVDVIFGCTDGQWGRSILNDIALFYAIPTIDMAVKIDSNANLIRSATGRVTVLVPGSACLFCRQRITPEGIRTEIVRENNPKEYSRLNKEGYVEGTDVPDPAVISFTSSVASFAVSEFLQRLTGFMGDDRKANETLLLFDKGKVSSNSTRPSLDCKCSSEQVIGRGDTTDFLGLTWDES